MTNTVSPGGWVDASKAYHLTIDDILRIPKGETVRIFFMDRNMFDVSCDKDENPVGKPVKPSQFFRGGYYIKYTKTEKSGLKGDWMWDFKGAGKSPEKREFDIDLGKCWYPLKNNRVPENDFQGLFKLGQYAGLHYTSIPKTTRVGWRGPMMLAKNMDKCPDIILREHGQID